MHKLITTFAAIVCVHLLQAQTTSFDYTFTMGPKVPEKNMPMLGSYAGQVGNNMFLVGFGGINIAFSQIQYVFQSYNATDMSLVAVKKLPMEGGVFKENKFVATDVINEEFCLFTYENSRENGADALLINYYVINKQTLEPSEKKALVTIPNTAIRMSSNTYLASLDHNITNYNYMSFDSYGGRNAGLTSIVNTDKIDRVYYVRSADKKQFYLVSIYESQTTGGAQSIAQVHIYAYNTDMTLAWEKAAQVPFDGSRSVVEGVDADNTGNVFFTIKNYKKKLKGESASNAPNYDYTLYLTNRNTTGLKSTALNTGNRFITQMDVAIYNDTVGAVCAGFYFDDNNSRKNDNVSGGFISVVDNKNGLQLAENYGGFDESFYNQNVIFSSVLGRGNDNNATVDLKLRKVYIRPNGDIIIIGERHYVIEMVSSTQYSSYSTSRSSYMYCNKDVVVSNISPNGKNNWTVRIPKYQKQSYTSYGSSIATLLNGDDLYILYNDHANNLGLTTTGEFENADIRNTDNTFVAVKINADAGVSKQKVSTAKDAGGMFCIQGALNINNKKLAIPVMNTGRTLVKYTLVDFNTTKE